MSRTNRFLSLIGGGQISFHHLRMASQVLRQILLVGIGIFCTSLALYIYIYIPWVKLKLFILYWFAYLKYHIFGWLDALVTIDGNSYLAGDILYASSYIQSVNQTLSNIIHGCYISAAITVVAFSGFLIFIYKQGRKQGQQKLLSGSTLVTPNKLNKLIKAKNQSSNLQLGEVYLPITAPSTNIAITGASGSGKSMAIKHLISQARTHKHSCIIYDATGQLTENYYNPATDILLNPFDARNANWSIFSEIKHDYEIDSLVAALIPESGNDPFWHSSARTMLKNIIHYVRSNPKIKDQDKLSELRKLVKLPVEQLLEIISPTKAPGAIKTLESVKAMIDTYMDAFNYLDYQCDKPTFAITDWITNNNDTGSCLFITALENQRFPIKPLLTCWMHCATTSILNLTPDNKRRLWYFIDEMPSLNKLPQLLHVLTNARKYGGCGVIGFQNIPQLKSKYPTDYEAILEGCATHLILQANGRETAKWASQFLRKQRIKEVNKSQSYGAHTMRDGITHSEQTREQPLVSEDKILELDILRAYIKTLNFPISLIKLEIAPINPQLQAAFIPRERKIDIKAQLPLTLPQQIEAGNDQHTPDDLHDKQEDLAQDTTQQELQDLTDKPKEQYDYKVL